MGRGRKVIPQADYEAALRHAFVDRRAVCIAITSRRQQFQIEAANYGIEQGWLSGELDERDEQSTVWIGRLTEKGREHFGLSAPASPEGVVR
jgi:hypothetical protein